MRLTKNIYNFLICHSFFYLFDFFQGRVLGLINIKYTRIVSSVIL